MQYTAPDGHIMESSPTETVFYSCPQAGMVQGTFFSLETYPINNSIGIQQMQITRVIDVDSIDISIRESTSEELIAYQQEVDGGASDSQIINNLFNQ